MATIDWAKIDWERITRGFDPKLKRFDELAESLRLDPKTTFRNKVLVGFDLARSNLAGYSFCGSDLRGCRVRLATGLAEADFADAVLDVKDLAALRKAKAEHPSPGAKPLSQSDVPIDKVIELILAGERVPKEWAEVVTELEFPSRAQFMKGLAPLSSFIRLRQLKVIISNIRSLAPLAHLTGLKTVILDDTQVADIAPIQYLAALQSLYLTGTNVADIAPIQYLAALQSLNLAGTKVADIAPLQYLAALQSLDLSFTQVANIAPLQNLAALQSLNLRFTQVIDIVPLQYLAGLQSLNLDYTQVADIAPLQNLAALQSLNLAATRVADLTPLKDLPNLKAVLVTDLVRINRSALRPDIVVTDDVNTFVKARDS